MSMNPLKKEPGDDGFDTFARLVILIVLVVGIYATIKA